jgi:hypothetical protein
LQHSLEVISTDGRTAIKAVTYIERYDPPFYSEPDSHLIEAAPRVPLKDCPARIPAKFAEALEQNQQIASCCRHPEHHLIGAYYTSAEWRDSPESKGAPDVYILFCTCGRIHRRKMFGSGGRPIWEIR